MEEKEEHSQPQVFQRGYIDDIDNKLVLQSINQTKPKQETNKNEKNR